MRTGYTVPSIFFLVAILSLAIMISACRNLGEQSSHDALYLMGARNWQYGEIAGDISQEVLSEYSQIFSMFDGNGDGLVNLQEYLDNSKYRGGDLSKIFAASDRDGDGLMTEQEYINNRIITDEAREIFIRMDANDDNTLSEAEFLMDCNISDERWAKELFKELDPQSREASSLPEFLKTYGDWAR